MRIHLNTLNRQVPNDCDAKQCMLVCLPVRGKIDNARKLGSITGVYRTGSSLIVRGPDAHGHACKVGNHLKLPSTRSAPMSPPVCKAVA